nr:hypothetical protein [Herbaspirillum sp. ASV7]
MKVMMAVLCTVLVSGCSTITQSDTQVVALTSLHEGKPVVASCTLINDKGSWAVLTPANVQVRKSNEDLDVVCKRGGVPDGLLKAVSRTAGSMWGNIIFGGGIGAIVDHSRGNGYDYPSLLPVKMGEAIIVDKKQVTEPVQAPTPATVTPLPIPNMPNTVSSADSPRGTSQ